MDHMNSNDLVDRHEVAINSLEFERQVRELRRVTALWLASRVFVCGDPLCRGDYTGLEPANPNEEGLPRQCKRNGPRQPLDQQRAH
jgi:hypothetical protein